MTFLACAVQLVISFGSSARTALFVNGNLRRDFFPSASTAAKTHSAVPFILIDMAVVAVPLVKIETIAVVQELNDRRKVRTAPVGLVYYHLHLTTDQSEFGMV
mmetsp:Transcript_29706/g.65821  ORF Transcript_29706/g.65821 Transcript_29706/m.65821 type:complete len:103 (-) Transcript_29706:163-471(-)